EEEVEEEEEEEEEEDESREKTPDRIIDFLEMRGDTKRDEFCNEFADGEMRGIFDCGGDGENVEQRSFTKFCLDGTQQSLHEYCKEFEVLIVPLIHLKADEGTGWRLV
ncbi:MAG: hypothetical protein KDK61_07095, partial [Simkania sp.]|nr:hypothetical protein [Simkania sp.]